MTMNFSNEADEIRALGRILEKGYVFRGLKPVNWCFDCGSALAEAEVEYADRVDPAVDVAFPFADRPALAKAFGLDSVDDGAIVIWTTTPWTIPSNQALNLHPEIEYALVRVSPAPVSGPLLLIAKDRVEDCLKQWQLEGDVIATAPGAALSGIRFRHPLAKANPGYDRTAPVYLGDYVTADSGTGVVHSAPAYGIEDFVSCKAHGMKDTDFISPVMGDGKYADSLPLFGGLSIWDANPKIVEALKLAGTLMHVEKHKHSYMHCWRHKTPIIYRATSQWFAGMDVAPKDGGPTLRESALAGIDATAFYPAWGRARLHAMIANRPDWTLSRQRQWGTPMAFFVHKETGELHPRTVELLEQVALRVEQGGIEAWQTLDPRELLGDEADQYEKNRDTLDVWFDSGSTHATVLGGKDGAFAGSHGAELAWPADLYGRFRPAPRLVPFLAADRLHALWPAALQGPADARLRSGRPGPQDEQVRGQRDRAAEGIRFARRRDPAPVGRIHRLLGRAVDLRRDPQARGRRLPPHPQHAALPAGPTWPTSTPCRRPCRMASCSKSTATRWP